MRYVTPLIIVVALVAGPSLTAQVSLRTAKPLPIVVQPVPIPATNLGLLHPDPGTFVTMGYDELTSPHPWIHADVREVRDASGPRARGVQLHIFESDSRELVFVDADEIPGLLRALDALLAVTENPTRFKSFEVRFTTRDNLSVVAHDTAAGSIGYLLQVGSPARITISRLDTATLLKIRTMFETALQKLQQVSGG